MSITLCTELPLLPKASATRRFVHVQVQAPERSHRTPRPALQVSLVLDRSGSMDGAKLQGAIEAAVQAVHSLQPGDLFSLVSFDHEVDLMMPSTPASPDAFRMAEACLRALQNRGYTNLSTGWLRGCEQIAGTLTDKSLGRALLLTDGQANQGITDTETLVEHARNLAARGVTTSTFGLGQDFNEALLSQMATAGRGNFYYIDSPQRIESCIAAEMGEALEVVARDVVLHVELPSKAQVSVLGDYEISVPLGVRSGSQRVAVRLGSLVSGQVLDLVLDVELPAGKTDIELQAQLQDADDQLANATATLNWTRATPEACSQASLEVTVIERVLALMVSRTRLQALALSGRGDLRGAKALFERAITEVQALPWQACDALTATVAGLKTEAERLTELNEHERRESYMSSYASMRSRDPRGRSVRGRMTNSALLDLEGDLVAFLREVVYVGAPLGVHAELDVLGRRDAHRGTLDEATLQQLFAKVSRDHAYASTQLVVTQAPLPHAEDYRRVGQVGILSLARISQPVRRPLVAAVLLATMLRERRDQELGGPHTTLHDCLFDTLQGHPSLEHWITRLRLCSKCTTLLCISPNILLGLVKDLRHDLQHALSVAAPHTAS